MKGCGGQCWDEVLHRPLSRDQKVRRSVDLLLVISISLLLIIPALLIALLVRMTSRGPALHWSRRIGRDNRVFSMPKFRTMRLDTPDVATHLLSDPERWLTPVGGFLRRSSLDEIPQLISILRGDMSFVGPRPALHNQDDLVALRTARGVHRLVPGLTGWAQVNGRDELSVQEKVAFDVEYMERQSLWLDLRITGRTLLNAFRGRDVAH